LRIPPLRERPLDIPLLAGYFIKQFARKIGKPVYEIDPEAVRTLQTYHFPGNVRELENMIERAMILTRTDMITAKDLGLQPPVNHAPPKRGTLEEIQKQAIIEALQRWEGNKTRAAEELGINRRTILNKLKEYGMDVS
jgi:DNA-binding NtrC family response regulator